MDAHSVALVVGEAKDAIAAGRDPAEVAEAMFHAGYGYGLSQGHYDRDSEYYGVEGGGEVLPTYYMVQGRVHSRPWADVSPWMPEKHFEVELFEQYQRTANPGEEFRLIVAHPKVARDPSAPKTAADLYAEQAKKRLASRVGEDLAEEFTSVAESTDLDTVNVAELMAAAYKMGEDSRNRKKIAEFRQARADYRSNCADYREAAGQPPASQVQEASHQAGSHEEAESVCQSTYAAGGLHDWDSYLGGCANPGCSEYTYQGGPAEAKSANDAKAIKANLASLNDIVGELVAKESGSVEFARQVLGTLRSHSFDLGMEFRGERGPSSYDTFEAGLDHDEFAKFQRAAERAKTEQPGCDK
jgi:hypothetical protein